MYLKKFWMAGAAALLAGFTFAATPITWTVSQTTGDDTAAALDATGATPFKHLQAAINKAKAGDTINVGPGTYGEEEGVTDDANGRSRIYISKAITVVATAGAAQTIIEGALDNGTVGPNAVRCVTMVGGAKLKDFTLKNGGTAADDSAKGPGRAGGVYTIGTNAAKLTAVVIGCKITNCASFNYGVYFCTMIGCKVLDCTSTGNYSGQVSGRAYFSIFANHSAKTYTTGGITAIHCTFYGNDKHDLYAGGDYSSTAYNCLLTKGAYVKSGSESQYVSDTALVDADAPWLADPVNGDFRILEGSAAYEGAKVALLNQLVLPDGMTLDDVRDPEGNAIDPNHLHIGAVQAATTVQTVNITDAGGELEIEGGQLGDNKITDTTEIKISVKATATRPCSGLMVNGEFVSFDDPMMVNRKYVITAATVAAQGGSLTVTPVYTTDWYMAANGSNDNNGFTPGAAKKTFAHVLGLVASGDTVHLAAGTYADNASETDGSGTALAMTATVTDVGTSRESTIRSRVVIPAGVTIEGADRDTTIIEGASHAAATAGEKGCGATAMTAVFLNGYGAKVRKCTLRNGHTQLVGDTDNERKSYESNMGGGVAAAPANRDKASAEYCKITGCSAYRGAAANGVTLINCLVTGNTAIENAIAYRIYGYGTLFTGNTCANYAVMLPYRLDHCTLFGDTMTGSEGRELYFQAQRPTICNTLVAGDSGMSGSTEPTLVANCLFATDGPKGKTLDASHTDGTCLYKTLAEMALDAEGRPVIGSNGGIGAANYDYYDADKFGNYDLTGAPRVMNGGMDIGALEADYRPEYKAAIKLRQGSVSDVSGAVTTENGAIKLTNGGKITIQWSHAHEGQCAVPVTFASGLVNVWLNGDLIDVLARRLNSRALVARLIR